MSACTWRPLVLRTHDRTSSGYVVLTSLLVAVSQVVTGTWYTFHGQIPPCPHGIYTELLLRVAVSPRKALRADVSNETLLTAGIAPTQSRHRLQGIRGLTYCQRLRHGRAVYTVFPCRRQGGFRRYPQQWSCDGFR